jgi:hypothetical protein
MSLHTLGATPKTLVYLEQMSVRTPDSLAWEWFKYRQHKPPTGCCPRNSAPTAEHNLHSLSMGGTLL